MHPFSDFTNGGNDPGPVSLSLVFFSGMFIGALIVLALVDQQLASVVS